MSKSLRFANLIRVSTVAQEQQGESLRTQRKQNERDVTRLDGKIVARYGGQEHATPGWEHKELDRLIADAAKGKFDAVIVSYADRWSRDNANSKQGLEMFRRHGIKFYVGTTEMDLFDPQHRFILGMNAEVGEFIALQQLKKSLESKIERAKRGLPTCGHLPYGRYFDTKNGSWAIDAEKQAAIVDIAKRYLAGESMADLASEFKMNHANLHKIMTRRCGSEWTQTFRCAKLDIDETVMTMVPALLTEQTIKAIRRRAEANRTWLRGQGTTHKYLLGHVVFCGNCGHALLGQASHSGCRHRYYRHACTYKAKGCGKMWVRADQLEESVFSSLFDLFGNPAAVQEAINAAVPDRKKVEEYRQRQGQLAQQLDRLAVARNRILGLITKGTIDDAGAEKELGNIKRQHERHQAELAQLTAELENVPDAKTAKQVGVWFAGQFKRRIGGKMWARMLDLNTEPDKATWAERRALVQMVFSGKLTDGRRMGVYIDPQQSEQKHKLWAFQVLGHLVDLKGQTDQVIDEFQGNTLQDGLLAVAQYASSRRHRCLPGYCFAAEAR